MSPGTPGDCLEESDVQAYLEHRLDGPATERVERHVDGCPACRDLISQLARAGLLEESEGDPASDPTLVADSAGGGSLTGRPGLEASPKVALVGDRYELQQRVARGGMGEIWRAVDRRRDRAPVAVKRILLPLDDPDAEQQRARLLREAHALQQLDHPAIVGCLDAGIEGDGQPYLVLEWLDGEDLASYRHRRRAPLPPEEALAVVGQVLAGLEVCHAADTIHRDLKPANIFLLERDDEGLARVKLIDFGLALIRDESTRLTRAGSLLGTLHYLSPEQAQGVASIDHRTDIYAMGVVLYELVTGQLPFVAHQPAALLLKIINETPAPPRRVRPDLSPALDAVIQRAMQRRPDRRFSSAEAMRRALSAVREGADEISSITVDEPAPVERRLVSLLCVRVDAAEHPRLEERLVATGARVQRLLDGQIVALFGLERTEGDEALRAVRAGERARLGLGPHGEPRLLVATVHVELSHEGLRIDGEELDRATGALAGLPPGELIVDRATGELLGRRATLEPLASGAGQLAAVRTLHDATSRRGVLGRDTPLFGREVEQAALTATLGRVVELGDPEALLIVGPPGIGKTRLIDEARPTLRGPAALYLEARPDSAGAATPYSLLADAVKRAAGIRLGDDDPTRRAALEALLAVHLEPASVAEAAPMLGEAIGVPYPSTPALRVARADPKVLRQRVADAFESWLTAAGRGQRSVILCLEDLHWADDQSLRLCQRLLERLEGTRLLVLGTTRPELLERHPALWREAEARHLALDPLGRRAVGRLARAILGQIDASTLEALVRQSEGNPLFAEELGAWLAGKDERGPEPTASLPTTVELALQGRLDRLASELKELLKAAAVFGGTFSTEGCVAIGFPAAPAQLAELAAGDFVVAQPDDGDQRWTFRHALVREVAYGMLPERPRTELHRRVGDWLERRGEADAARLALHFERAGEPLRAAHYQALAGQRALIDADPTAAVTLFERSLTADCAPDELARRARGLARAHYLLGSFAEVAAALDRFEPRLGPDANGGQRAGVAARAELRLLRGQLCCATSEYAAAHDALDSAAALLEGDDPGRGGDDERAAADLRFDVDHVRFIVMLGEGRYEAMGRQAEALGRLALREEQRCAAELAQAYVEVVVGDLGAAVALAERAAGRAATIGHPYRELDALQLLGSACELTGALAQATAALARASALAARLGSTYHLSSVACGQGRLRALGGALDEALRCYQDAESHAHQSGDPRSQALAMVGAARARCHRGGPTDLEQAARLAGRALELVDGRAPPVEAEARLALAEAALGRGDAGEATDAALEAVALLDRLGGQESTETEILLVAHDALAASGRDEEAATMLARAHDGVAARRARIGSPELAASFAERVPHNARVTRLWARRDDDDQSTGD